MSQTDQHTDPRKPRETAKSPQQPGQRLQWQRPNLTRIDVKRTVVCCGSCN